MVVAPVIACPDADSWRKRLDGKIAFLTTVINACMLWWVSSVVFCGSVLSTTYVKRKEILKLRNLNWFIFIVAFFILTIVAFGCGLGWLMYLERLQTAELLGKLKLPADGYKLEYQIFEWGLCLGTSSFVLVFITWVGIWKHLRKEVSQTSKRRAGENCAIS